MQEPMKHTFPIYTVVDGCIEFQSKAASLTSGESTLQAFGGSELTHKSFTLGLAKKSYYNSLHNRVLYILLQARFLFDTKFTI